MALDHTRTHTVYFTTERMRPLREAADDLRHDAESRGRFIGDEALEAMRRRLRVLDSAIDMLSEPVPPEYGG